MTLKRRHLATLPLVLEATAQPAGTPPTIGGALVVPFPAGGAADLVARMLAPALAEKLGFGFEVLNLPGHSGLTATDRVAQAAPDGTTLLVASNSTFITAAGLGSPLQRAADSLQPVGLLATTGLVLCINGHAPLPDLAALLGLLGQAGPPQAYASAGFGTTGHLAMEALLQRTGLDLQHLAVSGDTAALRALLTERVVACFCNAPAAKPYAEAGAVRVLAVSSAVRLPAFPTVPTLDEAGFPGFQASTDFALFAPAGSPAAVMRRLVAAMQEVMASPLMRRRLAIVSMLPIGTGPEDFAAYLEHERAEWRRLLDRRPLTSPLEEW